MGSIRNILLVYPQVPKNTFWSFQHALKFIGKRSSMPPLGLITVAAYIPQHINVRLVDENVARLKDSDIAWADAVFLSAMIVQKESFETVAARCKKAGKIVVAGGPHVTSSQEPIKNVDHFVLGEAETVMEAFMADLEQGCAKPVYKAEKRPDLAVTRTPRYDLLKRSSYASMAVQYSRGCPFHCEFCDIWKVYGNQPRVKPAARMLEELNALYDLNWRGAVFMVDDNFIGNKSKVKKDLLPVLIAWQKELNYPFKFYTEASINLADDEPLLEAMRDAAFNEVFIGIETPSVESLAETGKVQNLKSDMTLAIRKIQNYGMEVMGGFILGFDSDTDDIADRQIAFIQQAGIPRAMVGLLTALPGTDLHDRLVREDRILGVSGGNNVSCAAANFKTRQSPEALQAGYRKVLSTIYDRSLKNYFARCNRVLDTLKANPHACRSIKVGELRALFGSLLRQPFTPYGWQYIKFIARNLFKNTGAFPEAVKFSILGHHLHIITRKMLADRPMLTA
jgi:radical SAM superfamily enzyme YgiQ (UPF0313 family)